MHMPKQRRLDPDTKQEAVKMMNLKANKKMLQSHLIHMTGKLIVLKDLHNIHGQSKPNQRCDFQELANEMKQVKGKFKHYNLNVAASNCASLDAEITTFVDDGNMLQAIYFQTKEMKDKFKLYPEILFIDATYKLNDLRMPLYVLLTVDGNGESEIVCLWIVQNEEKGLITSLLVEFKKHNYNWSLIKCVMSDKDMTERNVIKEQLPQANLLICLFHTLRSFRREISCDKLGISQSKRIMCLELLSKMAYA